MDGKLLILCDELPGDYEHYQVKDAYFLKEVIRYPEDDPNRLYVCWDSIIPGDKEFIEKCIYYGTSYDKMPADFRLRQKGKIDPKHGNIANSIQEDSYIRALDHNIAIISEEAKTGADYRGYAMDLAVQYPLQAMNQFFYDFSGVLNNNGVIRILLAHKKGTPEEIILEREKLMEAWKNQNEVMHEKASRAQILESMVYEDFGEVYSRSSSEMMKIYSLPIF